MKLQAAEIELNGSQNRASIGLFGCERSVISVLSALLGTSCRQFKVISFILHLYYNLLAEIP